MTKQQINNINMRISNIADKFLNSSEFQCPEIDIKEKRIELEENLSLLEILTSAFLHDYESVKREMRDSYGQDDGYEYL